MICSRQQWPCLHFVLVSNSSITKLEILRSSFRTTACSLKGLLILHFWTWPLMGVGFRLHMLEAVSLSRCLESHCWLGGQSLSSFLEHGMCASLPCVALWRHFLSSCPVSGQFFLPHRVERPMCQLEHTVWTRTEGYWASLAFWSADSRRCLLGSSAVLPRYTWDCQKQVIKSAEVHMNGNWLLFGYQDCNKQVEMRLYASET